MTAPPLTAAHPLIPPPTTAGATWPISRPQCWTPPQTLPSSQRQILQECTSDTTVRFICFSYHFCPQWILRIDIVLLKVVCICFCVF